MCKKRSCKLVGSATPEFRASSHWHWQLVSQNHVIFMAFFVVAVLFAASSGGQQIAPTNPSPDTHWDFFRGNDFDGHSAETGLADQWPDRGPPVLWFKDLGVGYSGFVGRSGRVYTQYQNLSGQFVACLSASTGEKIWEQRYAWPYKPASLYPGPRSTPTLCDGRLFITTPLASVFCFDAITGEKIWELDAKKRFNAPEVEFGYACSPVCQDGKVFLPIGGKDASMVALDQANGAVVWHSGNAPVSYCSAYPIVFEKRKIIVGYFKNQVSLFDQITGNELSSAEVSGGYDEHSAWPIYIEPHLWVAGPFRSGSQLYRLESDQDKLRLRPVYRTNDMSNDVASCVLAGDHLYGFDIRDVQSKVHRPSRGQFTCMEFLSGKVNWRNGVIRRQTLPQDQKEAVEETVASDRVNSTTDIGHASVIVADGKLIMLNDTGELILGGVDSDSFIQLARTTILGGEIGWTQPILLDSCLFARNHSKAICVYLGAVEKLKVDPKHLKYTAEIEQPEYVDMASIILGTEPTYAMTAPTPKWLVRWFIISLGAGWVISPIVAISMGRFLKGIPIRPFFLLLAFCWGVVGTTLFGHWLNQFYFSWPICLAIVFELLVCQLKSSDESVKLRPYLARAILLLFVLVCVGFFLLCRRLSLPFEWTFLMGFPAALPFHWMVKRSAQRGDAFGASQWLWSALAFTAFYWLGAGVMLWKY